VREGPGLNHVLHGELPCDPGKVPDRSLGLEERRRSELDGGGPAAAAEAQAPANGWLSLINMWLGEVLWFTGNGWSSRVRKEIDWTWCSPSGGNGGRRRRGNLGHAQGVKREGFL
jgi:hypothetical protein